MDHNEHAQGHDERQDGGDHAKLRSFAQPSAVRGHPGRSPSTDPTSPAAEAHDQRAAVDCVDVGETQTSIEKRGHRYFIGAFQDRRRTLGTVEGLAGQTERWKRLGSIARTSAPTIA